MSRHLSDVREEIEGNEFPSLALADFFSSQRNFSSKR